MFPNNLIFDLYDFVLFTSKYFLFYFKMSGLMDNFFFFKGFYFNLIESSSNHNYGCITENSCTLHFSKAIHFMINSFWFLPSINGWMVYWSQEWLIWQTTTSIARESMQCFIIFLKMISFLVRAGIQILHWHS